MQWYEILIIILAAAFVVGVIAWRIVRRLQGKSGCDCGGSCSHCGGGCPACKPKNPSDGGSCPACKPKEKDTE